MTRSDDVFAAWDGRGELVVGVDETLDADDCRPQLRAALEATV